MTNGYNPTKYPVDFEINAYKPTHMSWLIFCEATTRRIQRIIEVKTHKRIIKRNQKPCFYKPFNALNSSNEMAFVCNSLWLACTCNRSQYGP